MEPLVGFALLHWRCIKMINNLMVAHRGYSSVYPENTMIAFRKAVEEGVNCIELDIGRTADNILVVLHDSTVERTTDGTGAISDLTWEQVQSLDAGSWKGSQFTGEKIPSFEQVLDEFRYTDIFILAELKYNPIYTNIEKEIADMIKRKRMEEQVMYFSFEWDSVDRFRKYSKSIRTGLLGSGTATIADAKTRAIDGNHNFISWGYPNITQNIVEEWHQAGLYVNVWTIDNEASLQSYYDMGVEILSSDFANYLANIVVTNNIIQESASYKVKRKAVPKIFNGTSWVKASVKKYENGKWIKSGFNV